MKSGNKKSTCFRFYAELNDFLAKEKRQRDIPYFYFGTPTVKDAIEALGVPHPEIDLILVSGRSVDFTYKLRCNDQISVYPIFELLNITEIIRLRPAPLRELRFILDVNLGKLAAKLRLLGFDSIYSNRFTDKEIIEMAGAEKRIILTRDTGILKNKLVTHGYWVRSTQPAQQIREVLDKFDLLTLIQPFRICLICNGLIAAIGKEAVLDQLPERTKQFYHEFFHCQSCGKIYWKGSHYQRMLKSIEEIRQALRGKEEYEK